MLQRLLSRLETSEDSSSRSSVADAATFKLSDTRFAVAMTVRMEAVIESGSMTGYVVF